MRKMVEICDEIIKNTLMHSATILNIEGYQVLKQQLKYRYHPANWFKTHHYTANEGLYIVMQKGSKRILIMYDSMSHQIKINKNPKRCVICNSVIINQFRKKYCYECWNNPKNKISGPRTLYNKELGHYVKSKLEEKVFKQLKRNNIMYQYSSNIKRCPFNQLPDAIVNNKIILEIKGWTRKNQTQNYKRCKKKHSRTKLVIISDNIKRDMLEFDFADKVFDVHHPSEYIKYFKRYSSEQDDTI
jgi:hypothetical protein